MVKYDFSNDDWIEQYYRDEIDKVEFPKLIKITEYHLRQGTNPEHQEKRLTWKHRKRLEHRVESMKSRLKHITGKEYKEV
tara:strand:- start:898 stop:1137 length:240 start_codon:yes stop_codon:yes gene_type:complete